MQLLSFKRQLRSEEPSPSVQSSALLLRHTITPLPGCPPLLSPYKCCKNGSMPSSLLRGWGNIFQGGVWGVVNKKSKYTSKGLFTPAILGVIFSFWTMWRSILLIEFIMKFHNLEYYFITDQLLHIVQKEKIAPKIEAEICPVNQSHAQ